MLALSQKYSGQPFEQLLFPCNQFMNQEPGTAKEIIDFVKSKFGIVYGTAGFTIMAKSDVNGGKTSPTYTYLKGQPGCAGTVAWNFSGKFLVKKDGTIVPLWKKTPADCAKAIDEALAA
mmetsp:Transcript_52598/g.125237  ORF Transcript_52598/g.125237 Transcript_52598/m.125237 type:complete len:119 (+) Transcript_52598:241-597(+)